MAINIPERFYWVVDVLNVQPDDHLLEIGCGHGKAVYLICDQLTSGKITALDRSDKMIATAKDTNQGCITAGKAEFHTTALDKFEAGSQSFNKIFSVNVNVFWLKPAKELTVIKELLKPEGVLYLFYGYGEPTTRRSQEVVDKINHNFQANGFSIRDVLDTEHGLCITAAL